MSAGDFVFDLAAQTAIAKGKKEYERFVSDWQAMWAQHGILVGLDNKGRHPIFPSKDGDIEEKQLADKILRGEQLPTDFEDLANIMAASYSQLYDVHVRMRDDFHAYACLVDDYISDLIHNTAMGKTSDNSWPSMHDKLCEETHLYIEYAPAPLNPHPKPFSGRDENGQPTQDKGE